jgi:hypothetical protein
LLAKIPCLEDSANIFTPDIEDMMIVGEALFNVNTKFYIFVHF